MTKRIILAAVAVLAICSTGGVVQFNAVTPAGGSFYATDDFSSDTITSGDWAMYDETPNSWFIGSGIMNGNASYGNAIYTPACASDTETYFCLKKVSRGYGGVKFRANSDDSNRAYVVRMTADNQIAWRHCAGTSCTDIEVDANTHGTDTYFGVTVEGTGTSTVVTWYNFGTNSCTSASGGDCDGSSCNTAAWSTNAASSGVMTTDPPTGTYPELDTNRCVGLYSGSTVTTSFDDWHAGDL